MRSILPRKARGKALKMVKNDSQKAKFDYLLKNNSNEENILPALTVKNISFRNPNLSILVPVQAVEKHHI